MTVVSFSMAYRSFRGGSGRLDTRLDTPPSINRRHPVSCLAPDPTTVEEAFEGIDGCFHLAAIASVVRSNREWLRTHEVNLTGTLNILNQARRLRHRREIPIVYASSAAIYGDCGTVPIGEETPVPPLSA